MEEVIKYDVKKFMTGGGFIKGIVNMPDTAEMTNKRDELAHLSHLMLWTPGSSDPLQTLSPRSQMDESLHLNLHSFSLLHSKSHE